MCVTITVVNVGNVNLVKRREVIDVNVSVDSVANIVILVSTAGIT
jgi:hypothetical protein